MFIACNSNLAEKLGYTLDLFMFLA